jgi:hypothetical protein
MHPTENVTQNRAAGQAQERTVHAQKPMAPPPLGQRRMPALINSGQNSPIEFNKSTGAQFGPGVSQRPAAESGRDPMSGQLKRINRVRTFTTPMG